MAEAVDPRLAALLAGRPVDFDTADILAKVHAEQARKELRGPRPPGPIGPDGREIEFPEGRPPKPDRMPSWYRNIQPYDINVPAAIQGMLMSSGTTGGPGGAVTGAFRHGAEQIAASPLAQRLAGLVGMGGAGAVAGMPSEVGSADNSLDQMTHQLNALIKQREAAQAERESQVKGGKGITPGRGKNYEAANEELRRVDDAIGKMTKIIEVERYNQSPAGVLEAETKRKAFEDQKKAEEYGKPIREHLPAWASNALPAIATGAGIGTMMVLKGRANKEYGRALEGFREAEKGGNLPEMALRRAQLADLEKGTVGGKLATGAAALLPAEVRLIETVIDANNDPKSRASKEAWARIKDPASLAWDVGTTGLSSALAYGIGSKFAPHQPDRSLGRAIAAQNPYGGATHLADDYGSALKLSEGLRRLRQSAPGAQALEANPPAPPDLAKVLAQPSPTQGQLPPRAGGPNQALAETLAMRPPANVNAADAPKGVIPGVDKLGRPYHKDPDNQQFTKKPGDPG
jgi:hypothetical protein